VRYKAYLTGVILLYHSPYIKPAICSLVIPIKLVPAKAGSGNPVEIQLGLFGFVLALIGFVFGFIGFELGLFWLCFFLPPSVKNCISHCYESACVHFVISEIGFVLHN
jgi:apolipoprotein N-acyltransferase